MKELEREYKITMINRLKALAGKVDNIQERVGNVSREMEILRNNQKEMQNSVTKMKDAFVFISRIGWHVVLSAKVLR